MSKFNECEGCVSAFCAVHSECVLGEPKRPLSGHPSHVPLVTSLWPFGYGLVLTALGDTPPGEPKFLSVRSVPDHMVGPTPSSVTSQQAWAEAGDVPGCQTLHLSFKDDDAIQSMIDQLTELKGPGDAS